MKYHIIEIGFSGDANGWVYEGEIYPDLKPLNPQYYTDPTYTEKTVSFETIQEAEEFIIKHGKEEKWFIKVGEKELPAEPRQEDF